jgi:hypothetical protein
LNRLRVKSKKYLVNFFGLPSPFILDTIPEQVERTPVAAEGSGKRH